MYTAKQLILRIFFITEVMLFSFIYLFGPHGMHTLQEVQSDIDQIQKKQKNITASLETLHNQIDAWQMNDFYKERAAREQLQMARDNETIYYLTYDQE